MKTPTYRVLVSVPQQSLARTLAPIRVRNTSPFDTFALISLFEEVLRQTSLLVGTQPHQFNWLYDDFHLWFKTCRSRYSDFSGSAIHGSLGLCRPPSIVLRIKETTPTSFTALLMEHEIRHLMGENHARMKGTRYEAYRSTARCAKLYYQWADTFNLKPALRPAAGRSNP